MKPYTTNESPKILSLDIETFPNLVYAWGLYEQNALSVEQASMICAFSAKWLNGKQITKAIPDYKGYKSGDVSNVKMMLEIWDLLDQADIVVAHNGDNFDLKHINAAFVKLGMKPPSPYKTVDTLKVARNKFYFGSNRLNDLGKSLGLGEKLENGGFKLWKACMAGDKKAWKLMKDYNAQDVVLLEKVYLRLLPWMSTHPNVGMFTDKIVCPKCGSGKLQARGWAVNATTRYRRVQCMSCGGWGRETKNTQVVKPIVNAN